MHTQLLAAAILALSAGGGATPTPQLATKLPAGFGPRPFQLGSNSTIVGEPDSTSSSDDAASTFYSSNWAGIIQPNSGSAFTTAVGTVTLPTCGHGASGNGPWYNAYWVGIDGYTNQKALLQAGVICEYQSSGAVSYVPWVEYYPNPLIELSGFPMKAGDKVTVTITILSPTSGRLAIADATSGQSTTTTLHAPAATNTLTGQDAEWILEDFSSGGGLVPFASFTPCDWTNSYATESSGSTVDAYSSGEIVTILENSGGTPITSVAENGIEGLVIKYTGAT